MQDNDTKDPGNDPLVPQVQPTVSADNQQNDIEAQDPQAQPAMDTQVLVESGGQTPELVSEQVAQDSSVESSVANNPTPPSDSQMPPLSLESTENASNPLPVSAQTPETAVNVAPASPVPSSEAAVNVAPVAMPTSSSMPANAADGISGSGKKSGKVLAIILSLSAIAVVAVVAIVVLLVNSNKLLSVSDVEKYCKDNSMSAMTGRRNENEDGYEVDYVICSSDSDEVSSIQYAVYNKPLKEIDGFESSISYYKDNTLVDDGGYIKIYTSYFGTSTYTIIKDNTYMDISGSREAMKKVLIDLGYPDDKWADASMDDDYDYDYNYNYEEEDDEMQITFDDSSRKSDMIDITISLMNYRYENKEGLAGPSYWDGSLGADCEADNVACQFVKEYIIDDETEDESMEDPDGIPYSVYITENWVNNDNITTSFGSSLSNLVLNNSEYTIGGSSPFDAHVIYIIPGAECNEDNNGAIKSQEVDNYAVLYQLESGSTYCADL